MNTLTNYFQERLVEAGFPADLKLEWSLNYRQDKGHVAFYGDISYQDLLIFLTMSIQTRNTNTKGLNV
ncbi:hypothetical protein INT80_10960 [Gallibacterium anatis]|uniref:Uncharacterized protein n=1 Tax=Gallibacterium anatis TaxID=750 RepID=A0A930UWJ6_9PAST|nr:hypothetical protein [Gallibacterium anatis]